MFVIFIMLLRLFFFAFALYSPVLFSNNIVELYFIIMMGTWWTNTLVQGVSNNRLTKYLIAANNSNRFPVKSSCAFAFHFHLLIDTDRVYARAVQWHKRNHVHYSPLSSIDTAELINIERNTYTWVKTIIILRNF